MQELKRKLAALSRVCEGWTGLNDEEIYQNLAEEMFNTLPLEFVWFIRTSVPAVDFMKIRSGGAEKEERLKSSLVPSLGLVRGDVFPQVADPDGDGMLTCCATPAGIGEAEIMVLAGSRRETFPAEDDSLLLTQAAGQLSLASQQRRVIRLEKELLERIGILHAEFADQKRAEQTARFLADASKELAVLVDFETTLNHVASMAVPHFADWATVDILEADGSLRRVAVAHVDPAKKELAYELTRRFPADPSTPHGVWGVIRSGEPEWVREITDDILVQTIPEAPRLEIIRQLGITSYIGVPLKIRGKVIAVLTFVAAESGHLYDEADLTVAEDLAARSAIAIENASLYRELREADRRKDEFVATLAHELRNPLAPIRSGLEVLRRSGSDGEKAAEVRLMMERQLTHMVRLVDDLLDLSRITRNQLDLQKQRIELRAVLQSAVETSCPLIERARHSLTLDLPNAKIYLDADPVRLAQIFSNLLNNAAKYTDKGGEILLSAERDGEQVAIRVRDNGLGISRDALPRLFQMFSQVGTTSHANGGLGIGLMLVRRLVELHGGTVEAHSEGIRRGSEFVVRLPVAPQAEAVKEVDRPEKEGEIIVQSRILVVDDNEDAATSLGTMLELMGHQIQTAHDGLAAVEAATLFRPDVILLDIGLPKLDGYEACRRIRQMTWAKEITIIAITGWGQEEDRLRSQEAGFDHHFTKPVESAALQRLLNLRGSAVSHQQTSKPPKH